MQKLVTLLKSICIIQMKKKTKNFPDCPIHKRANISYFSKYMVSIKPKNCRPNDKLICDWSDEQNYLVLYRHLKVLVKLGKKIEKVNKVISFKQKPCLVPYFDQNTQKRAATNDRLKTNFCKLLNSAF